jgi:hypothetical protein
MKTFSTLAPRHFTGVGLAALLAAIGLFASRPAHTAGGPVPVTVANTVQTQNVDNSDRQPFQMRTDLQVAGGFLRYKFVTVPNGKRLVIESLTAGYNGNSPSSRSYSIQVESNSGHIGLSLTPGADPFPIKTQTVRLTTEARSDVSILVFASGGPGNISISLSGHYVDVP